MDAKEGEVLITAVAGREAASKEARVKVFSVGSFTMMLLEKIGDAGVQRSAARSSQRGLAMIWG